MVSWNNFAENCRFKTVIYLVLLLYHEFGIIIDRSIGSTENGKYAVYGLNSVNCFIWWDVWWIYFPQKNNKKSYTDPHSSTIYGFEMFSQELICQLSDA